MRRTLERSLAVGSALGRTVLRHEAQIAFTLFGAFLCACTVLWVDARYDDAIIQDVVRISKVQHLHGFAKAKRLMSIVYGLMEPRHHFFHTPEVDPTGHWFATPSKALLTGRSGCGDFVAVFTRVMQLAGERAKPMQMKCPPDITCHVLTEVKIDGKWIVMDPLYNFAPTDPRGAPLGAAETHKDWARISLQTPKFYIKAYNYERVEGTNWSKYGAASRAVRGLLVRLGIDGVDDFSIREYVLNLYRVYLIIALSVGLPLFGLWFLRLYRRRKIGAAA